MFAILISSFAMAGGFTPGNDDEAQTEICAAMKIDINIVLTSKDGCKFHVVGNVSWSGNFTGTVTVSGGGDCPDGEYTFGISDPGGNIEIYGDATAVKMLREDEQLLGDLIAVLTDR